MEFEVPKSDLAPGQIHPYTLIGWKSLARSVLGMGIKNSVNYTDFADWKLNSLHFSTISLNQEILINMTPPVFRDENQIIKVNVFENKKKIYTYEIPVRVVSEDFFSIIDSGTTNESRDIYIYYNNQSLAGKKVEIEFTTNRNRNTLFVDYLGPYTLNEDGKLFIAQEYQFSDKILNEKNLTSRFVLTEKGKTINEAFTKFI